MPLSALSLLAVLAAVPTQRAAAAQAAPAAVQPPRAQGRFSASERAAMGERALAYSRKNFDREVLLDRLGGDPLGEGADLELVVAEQVGVIGGGEVGGQFANLHVDGLANSLSKIFEFGLLLG